MSSGAMIEHDYWSLGGGENKKEIQIHPRLSRWCAWSAEQRHVKSTLDVN